MNELKYLKSHEWIEAEGVRRKVGISGFAQEQLGDIVFFEAPAVGKVLKAGDEAGVIESCKATSSIYAPLAGKVVAVNAELEGKPQLINEDPTGAGWLFEIEVEGEGAGEAGLLDAAAYAAYCEEQ